MHAAAAAIRKELRNGRLEVRHLLRLLLHHPILCLELLVFARAVHVEVPELLLCRREFASKLLLGVRDLLAQRLDLLKGVDQLALQFLGARHCAITEEVPLQRM